MSITSAQTYDDIQQVPQIANRYATNLLFELHKKAGKEANCPICLESVLECREALAVLLPCLHMMHFRCLFDQQRPECPICRPSTNHATTYGA